MPGLPEEKEESNAPRSPGMKYRHYKPDSRIILFQDPGEIPKILDEEKPDNPAVIGLDSISVDGVQSFHFPSAEELGKNLYSLFYELEKEGVDLILIEKIPMIGLGKTIMNRVLKAADRIV
jgi:L-threonylcarbamoyladenylate synthase